LGSRRVPKIAARLGLGVFASTIDLGTGSLVCPTAGTPSCGFPMKR
jgi:hypothetical protein